jgi:hypothetical protein
MFWGLPDHSITAWTSVQIGPIWVVNAQVRATKSCSNFSQTIPLLHELGCKSGRIGVINAQVPRMMSPRKFSQRTHQIQPIGPQTHVLWHFRPFHYWMNFGAKWAEQVKLMHKFVQPSRVGIFCNERTRSTTLDPKLIFWGVSDHSITTQTLE